MAQTMDLPHSPIRQPYTPQPTTPLHPLSPERVNSTLYTQRPPAFAIPQSPSLPTIDPGMFKTSPSKTSDVAAMVARFNGLDIRDHVEARRRDEAALKRAQMGREEAEGEARRLREERRACKKELEEVRERERKVGRRLDVVMEEFQRARETHAHATTLYEKEIRRARKEAFKSSSAMVKLQEELKATRASLRITQSGLDLEKQKAAKREQEAFEARFRLVEKEQECQRLTERLKVVEEERDALKTALKEEEVARIAAEGRIALPVCKDEEDDEFDSPAKSPKKKDVEMEDKENVTPKRMVVDEHLREELDWERRRREQAEEQIEFMKMECQFRCCACRLADHDNRDYIHDTTGQDEIEHIKTIALQFLAPSLEEPMETDIQIQQEIISPTDSVIVDKPTSLEQQSEKRRSRPSEPRMSFSPNSGTFHRLSSPTPAGDVDSEEEATVVQAMLETERAPTPLRVVAEPDIFSEAPAPAARVNLPRRSVRHSTTRSEGQLLLPSELSAPALAPAAGSPPPSESELLAGSEPELHGEEEEVRGRPSSRSTAPSSPSPARSPSAASETIERTPSPSPTRQQRPYHTITTTTTIPLTLDSPLKSTPLSVFPHTTPTTSFPPSTNQTDDSTLLAGTTITRSEALEQIRQRRGRARSIAAGALTPRKQMVDGVGAAFSTGNGVGMVGRRDISAPGKVDCTPAKKSTFGGYGKGDGNGNGSVSRSVSRSASRVGHRA